MPLARQSAILVTLDRTIHQDQLDFIQSSEVVFFLSFTVISTRLLEHFVINTINVHSLKQSIIIFK